MLPIKLIKAGRQSGSAPGSLLIPVGMPDEVIMLRFDAPSAKLVTRLDLNHKHAFKSTNIEARHEPAIEVKKWELRVDPSTAYSAFSGDAQPGDAFIIGKHDKAGFVIRLQYMTGFVTIDGDLIDEPSWIDDYFVGFKAWTVGYMHDGEFVEVVSRQPSAGAAG